MALMRFLRRVRADLLAGANLEIYTTALLSLVLAVLGALGAVGGEVLAAATLATLALLAGGMLTSRRQVAELTAEVRARGRGEISAAEFLGRGKADLLEHVRAAQDIRIVGVTLSRTLRDLVDELQRRAVAGAVVRVALIDPAGPAPEEAARRSTTPDRAGMYRNRLLSSVDLLRELAETPGAQARVEVRFLDFVPAFGLVLIDAHQREGRIHVDLYSHGSASGDAVFTVLPHRDGEWFQHFRGEFDKVWEQGRPTRPMASPCPRGCERGRRGSAGPGRVSGHGPRRARTLPDGPGGRPVRVRAGSGTRRSPPVPGPGSGSGPRVGLPRGRGRSRGRACGPGGRRRARAAGPGPILPSATSRSTRVVTKLLVLLPMRMCPSASALPLPPSSLTPALPAHSPRLSFTRIRTPRKPDPATSSTAFCSRGRSWARRERPVDM